MGYLGDLFRNIRTRPPFSRETTHEISGGAWHGLGNTPWHGCLILWVDDYATLVPFLTLPRTLTNFMRGGTERPGLFHCFVSRLSQALNRGPLKGMNRGNII